MQASPAKSTGSRKSQRVKSPSIERPKDPAEPEGGEKAGLDEPKEEMKEEDKVGAGVNVDPPQPADISGD